MLKIKLTYFDPGELDRYPSQFCLNARKLSFDTLKF